MAVQDATDWRAQAREMRIAGMSERMIAEEVGKAPSTVHEALKEQDMESPQIPGQQTIDGREVVVDSTAPPPEEIVVPGTQQLSLDVGGKRAQTAVISFTGGKARVDGFFRKGDRIVFQAVAVVRETGQRDVVDKPTGQVTDAVERYSAQILDMVVLED